MWRITRAHLNLAETHGIHGFFQQSFADKRSPYDYQVRLAGGDLGTDFLTAKYANYANGLRKGKAKVCNYKRQGWLRLLI